MTVASVISEIYQENLHILFIPLCTYPWLPQSWASWVGLQSPPMAMWQKWITFSAHCLSSWEAPISGNSPSLRVCAVLFAHDPLLSGTSWSDMTLVHFPMGAEQVIFLLQPLSLSLNELFFSLFYFIKAECYSIPWGPVLEAWLWDKVRILKFHRLEFHFLWRPGQVT